MRMCYAWLLKFSFFLHLLSLFVSHLIPLYPFFLFPRLFLLFRVYSFQQLRAHLVSIPMTMSSSFVKITVMLGVVFTKPFPRQSVSSSLFLTYVSALSSRQVYRPLIPAETIFKGRAWINQSINKLYLPSNLQCSTQVLISSSQLH